MHFPSFSQNDPEDESGYPVVRHGKLSLVDLAGKIIKGDCESCLKGHSHISHGSHFLVRCFYRQHKSLHTSQVADQAGAYPGFCSMKRQGVFLSTQYTCGWREVLREWSVLFKNTTKCPRLELKPELLDPGGERTNREAIAYRRHTWEENFDRYIRCVYAVFEACHVRKGNDVFPWNLTEKTTEKSVVLSISFVNSRRLT